MATISRTRNPMRGGRGIVMEGDPDDRRPDGADSHPYAVRRTERDGLGRLRQGVHARGEKQEERGGRHWSRQAVRHGQNRRPRRLEDAGHDDEDPGHDGLS